MQVNQNFMGLNLRAMGKENLKRGRKKGQRRTLNNKELQPQSMETS